MTSTNTWLQLLRLSLKNLLGKRILIITIVFLIIFDIFIGIYVLRISKLIYNNLNYRSFIDQISYFRLTFLLLAYGVYAFSFTMLAVELPLDQYSRELENGAAEILSFYSSRDAYFFSKLLALYIVVFTFIIIHLSMLYLIFQRYIALDYWCIIELSLKLLYQISIILSISVLLDVTFKRVKLVPSLLGILNTLAGSYVFASGIINLSLELTKSGKLIMLINQSPENVAKIYLILAKLASLQGLIHKFNLLDYLVYPFINYFSQSLYYSLESLDMSSWIRWLHLETFGLLDALFPAMWSAGLLIIAYLEFKYRDI
jgi:hypothetical protein